MQGSQVEIKQTGPSTWELRSRKDKKKIATFESKGWAEWMKDQIDQAEQPADMPPESFGISAYQLKAA